MQFVPSSAFTQSRPGYVFQQGAQGLGYYVDPKTASAAPATSTTTTAKTRAAMELILPALPNEADQMDVSTTEQATALVKTLAKLTRVNLEQRTKHSADPQKFLQSELALDEHLNKMSALATRPDLLEPVATSLAVELAALLTHDNEHLSRDVIGLLKELTEPDNYEGDSRASAIKFVDALLDNDLASALVQNLPRAAAASLVVLDNLCQIYPTAVPEHLCRRTALLPHLLDAVQAKHGESEDEALECSELLAVVLAGSREARDVVGSRQGLDALLLAAFRWKKRDPLSGAEVEWCENVWDCICLILSARPDVQDLFGALQGIELVLKLHGAASTIALKALDYCLQNSKANCVRFVQAGGLKLVFPVFMGGHQAAAGAAAKKQKRRKHNAGEDAEKHSHVLSVFGSLARHLPPDSVEAQRFLLKFDEPGKVERLVESRHEYALRLDARVAELETSAPDEDGDDEEEELDGEEAEQADDEFLERLDAGLEQLQWIDRVVGVLQKRGLPETKRRLRESFERRGMDMQHCKEVLVEMALRITDADEDVKAIVDLADGF
jgi:beta-catenin-like protein 1